MEPLAKVLQDISQAGWLVNWIGQLSESTWKANLRLIEDENLTTLPVKGRSMYEVLALSLVRADQGLTQEWRPTKPLLDDKPLVDITAVRALIKPRRLTSFERRI